MTEMSIGAEGVIFLGTGPSSAIPQLAHILPLGAMVIEPAVPHPTTLIDVATLPKDETSLFPSNPPRQGSSRCEVCVRAMQHREDANRRNNLNIILKVECQQDSLSTSPAAASVLNIAVDIGKTFRDSALNWLPTYDICSIDAVILTHSHSDAIGGLDDLRDLQPFGRCINSNGINCYNPLERIKTYVGRQCYKHIQSSFPYIVKASQNEGPFERKIPVLDFHILPDAVWTCEDLQSTDAVNHFFADILPEYTFNISGCTFVCMPVYHGGLYTTLALRMGPPDAAVVILLDVSDIPPLVDLYISSLPNIKLIIIDALSYSKPNFAHFCLIDALQWVKKWQPLEVLFVGASCDIDVVEANVRLSAWVANCVEQDCNFKTRVARFPLDGDFISTRLSC